MREFRYNVIETSRVKVTLDESEFDEKFLQEFRSSFYDFTTIEEHVEHISQMVARGLLSYDDFLEGYGYINGVKKEPCMNITARVEDTEVEVEEF